jgi:alkylresorcinol/alkylpyrone synthase
MMIRGILPSWDTVSYTETSYRSELGYIWRNGRLRVKLGKRVPELAAHMVQHIVKILLERNRLQLDDVAHWVVHAAGSRVLDSVRDGLKLPDDKLNFSRAVLRQHGNCSAATIGLIGKMLMEEGKPYTGDYGLVVAVGPGITAGAALLKWV